MFSRLLERNHSLHLRIIQIPSYSAILVVISLCSNVVNPSKYSLSLSLCGPINLFFLFIWTCIYVFIYSCSRCRECWRLCGWLFGDMQRIPPVLEFGKVCVYLIYDEWKNQLTKIVLLLYFYFIFACWYQKGIVIWESTIILSMQFGTKFYWKKEIRRANMVSVKWIKIN